MQVRFLYVYKFVYSTTEFAAIFFLTRFNVMIFLIPNLSFPQRTGIYTLNPLLAYQNV